MEKSHSFSIFYNLFSNIGKIFYGKNLLLQIIAIILTYISVISGFDWFYYRTFQIPTLWPILIPAAILGFILPILLPLFFLAYGAIKKSSRSLNTAFALIQTEVLAWLLSSFYKTFTGRPGPEHINILGDVTHIFRFGFLRGGIFWGWPSSHATVAFAMAITLLALCPENKFVKFLCLTYAIYVGIAVSMTIHWFSDALAGAIFGTLIGLSVGKSFFERYKIKLLP